VRDEIMRDERGPVGRLVHERGNGRKRAKKSRGEARRSEREKKEEREREREERQTVSLK